MNVGVVVLAAGEAKRFGSAKLVAKIDGVPLVRRAAIAALAVGTQVIVVSGAHREAVETCIADLAAERAFNAKWMQGMGGSIACGVAKLALSVDAVIVMLADQALIGTAELRRLIDAHAAAPGHIIAAQFKNVLGPPCLFPRRYFAELAALQGEHGARVLLQRHARRVEALPLPAAGLDIDTPQDLSPFTSGA
jgi:molybdenum cofactor cytidylyltransferase